MLKNIKNIIKSTLYPYAEMSNFPISKTFQYFIFQKILRINADVKWPVHWSSIISPAENVIINKKNEHGKFDQPWPGVAPGNYIQAINKVIIGDYCWLGANSNILKGVELGSHTIIGAGAVVTKSFPDGFCVLAGNPAKIIKYITEIDFE